MNNTTKQVQWKNEGEAGDASWVSVDQRFDIEPTYNHSTRPQGYRLHDRKNKTSKFTHQVGWAKGYAEDIVRKEQEEVAR